LPYVVDPAERGENIAPGVRDGGRVEGGGAAAEVIVREAVYAVRSVHGVPSPTAVDVGVDEARQDAGCIVGRDGDDGPIDVDGFDLIVEVHGAALHAVRPGDPSLERVHAVSVPPVQLGLAVGWGWEWGWLG